MFMSCCFTNSLLSGHLLLVEIVFFLGVDRVQCLHCISIDKQIDWLIDWLLIIVSTILTSRKRKHADEVSLLVQEFDIFSIFNMVSIRNKQPVCRLLWPARNSHHCRHRSLQTHKVRGFMSWSFIVVAFDTADMDDRLFEKVPCHALIRA